MGINIRYINHINRWTIKKSGGPAPVEAAPEFFPHKETADWHERGAEEDGDGHEQRVSESGHWHHVDHEYSNQPTVYHEEDVDTYVVTHVKDGLGNATPEEFVAVGTVKVGHKSW